MNGSEYRTVALAALLHDIGKLLNRVPGETARHPALSEQFVREFPRSFEQPELLATLVKQHHETPRWDDEFRVQSIEDPHVRTLAYIISRADNYSSAERGEAREGAGFAKFRALDCIFSYVTLGDDKAGPARWKYPLQILTPGAGYPRELDELDGSELEAHVDSFYESFRSLQRSSSPLPFETIYHLLEKYTWCIPSDVTREPADVSLFDHLRTTSALAACSYRYHVDGATLQEQHVTNDDIRRFLLVGLDINGIQSYLYDISGTGRRAVAKRLRARSFYLSLLAEAINWRILRSLDLPLSCRLMSAGGQAFLLLPNSPQAKDALQSEINHIQSWLLNRFHGELGVSIASVELAGSDFAQGQFHLVLEALRDRVNLAKRKKFSELLTGPQAHVMDVDYQHGVCATCHKFPNITPGVPEQEAICHACQIDEDIGKWLPRTHALAFVAGLEKDERTVRFFDDQPLSVVLLPGDKQPPQGTELYYRLRDTNLRADVPSGFLSYCMHLPTFSDAQELEDRCARCELGTDRCEHWKDISRPGRAAGAPKTFQCIAAACDGVQRLGYLRGDVDRLGLIFALGLAGEEKQASQVSLSRLATMSRMLEYFFGWGLNELISRGAELQGERVDLSEVYVTYSGGDDLLVVAPWQTALHFAQIVEREFRRFTAQNPSITLSAGIAIASPRCPISTAARMSKDLLDQSKNTGRARITMFSTVLPWLRAHDAQEWAKFFVNAIFKRKSEPPRGIPRAFLYRLLAYRKMHEDYRTKSDPRGALYRSRLAYDIGRNFLDNEGNPHDKEVVERLERLLAQDADDMWYMLRWPINWALLATREEDGHGPT